MIKGDIGRLFAVVHIRGLQRKVTTEDLVIVHGSFPPNIGERIRLEKVKLSPLFIFFFFYFFGVLGSINGILSDSLACSELSILELAVHFQNCFSY